VHPPEIPWCAPDLSGNEVRYVTEATAAGQVGPAGEFLTRFEEGVADAAGARNAVATSSGTSAVQVMLQLAGVRPGEGVIVPAWTFIATANAVRHGGAYPIVVDVDPESWQLDPAQVERFLTENCRSRGGRLVEVASGRPVTAVMPVHLLGHSAPIDELRELADRFGLSLVADAAQALGARYRDRLMAAGVLSAISFNANKLITTGGGGAIVTDDPEIAARARYLIGQARDHPTEYQHGQVGYNYRLSNLAAAIGCAQLERLGVFLAAKERITAVYRAALADVNGLTFQSQRPWALPNRWLVTITVDEDTFGMSSRALRAGSPEEALDCACGLYLGNAIT
jgi:perosamine synthetase